MKKSKTIFITGVSSGFGRTLAEAAAADGHKVIGTVRREDAIAAFEALAPGKLHGVVLDVTDFDRIDAVVAQVEAELGPVDVLVNNAGYGHEGVMEESPLDEIQRQFAVNLFGAVAMIKAFLPYFRKRRAGHILNISSMGGTITMPGISYYCGSKFALDGISDSLSQELEPFKIFVTAIAPGSFRTDWAGRSMQHSPRSIPDCDSSFDPVRKKREERSGKQIGDPMKAAAAMLNVINSQYPPRHLLLGSDAWRLVRDRLEQRMREIYKWKEITLSTDG